jgi:ATP citrate (pro-S)-lyase
MSAKAVSEASGKRLLNSVLTTAAKSIFASVNESSNFDEILRDNPWLSNTVSSFDLSGFFVCLQLLCSFHQKLVVKPDQLIKRRGKLGLILVNADYKAVKDWIQERIGKDTQVCI